MAKVQKPGTYHLKSFLLYLYIIGNQIKQALIISIKRQSLLISGKKLTLYLLQNGFYSIFCSNCVRNKKPTRQIIDFKAPNA